MVWVLRLGTPKWSHLLTALLLQRATVDLLRNMWCTLWWMTRMMLVTQLATWGRTLRHQRRRMTRMSDASDHAMVTICPTAPSGHAEENVRTGANSLCGNLNPTQPHTLGMWSQRLGAVHSTSCGDLCRCTTLAQMKCPERGDPVTDHWIQASKKVAETIRVKERTVKDLLRDYMMTTMCRWNEEAGPVSHHLGAVMHELATNVEAATDISPPDISTSSSRRHRSKLVVPVEVAEKGLGDTGAIDIPDSVWDAMAPANFLWASEGTPPQPFSSDPPLVALVHTLLGQQLVAVSPSQKPPNARAYVQHKNEHKCSLILPMLDLNARCVDPLPFKLRTLDGLAHLLQLCALRREQLFYCTLDISNHFWSCRLPPAQRDSIRVGVGGAGVRTAVPAFRLEAQPIHGAGHFGSIPCRVFPRVSGGDPICRRCVGGGQAHQLGPSASTAHEGGPRKGRLGGQPEVLPGPQQSCEVDGKGGRGGPGRSAECPSTTGTPHLLLASTSHHRVYGKSAEAHAGETTVGSAAREGGTAIRGWRLPLAQPGTQHCKVYRTQGSARPLGRHCLCVGPMGAPRHSEIH